MTTGTEHLDAPHQIRRWKVGESLRAQRLNEMVDQGNTLARGADPAKQIHRASPKVEEPGIVAGNFMAAIISDAPIVAHSRFVPMVRMFVRGSILLPYPSDNSPNGPYALGYAYTGFQWSSYTRTTRPVVQFQFDHNVGFPAYVRPVHVIRNIDLPDSIKDAYPGVENERLFVVGRP